MPSMSREQGAVGFVVIGGVLEEVQETDADIAVRHTLVLVLVAVVGIGVDGVTVRRIIAVSEQTSIW